MKKFLLILLFIPLLSAQQAVGLEGIKWMFNANDYIVTSLAIRGDVLFFGSANGNFYAVNSTTGISLWNYGTVGRLESSPAVSDDMVFFGSNDGYLYALMLNGSLAWKFQTGGIILSSPAVSDDMVFFGSNDGYLYALMLNGSLAWKFQTGDKILSAPLLAYGLLYFDSTDGSVYTFSPKTGKMVWNYSGEAPFASSPIASNFILYVGSDDGTLYAFNTFNGTLVWKQRFPGKIQSSFAVSPNNMLYFTCRDGNVYAVYAADGSRFWNITTGTEAQSSVRYDDDSKFIYFGTSDNNVYAANLTGSVAWRFETGNWVISTPLVRNGMLYVGSYDGNLYAVSTVRTSFPSQEMNVVGSPVSINGTAYADAGVKYVQVRLKLGAWENASGTTNWSYAWDTSSLEDGEYMFEARSVDALDNIEAPPYPSVIVRFRSKAEEKELVVSYQKSVVVGIPVIFEVNDTEGNPVPYPEVTIFGRTYRGDENGVVSRDESGNFIKSDVDGNFNFTVSKEGYRAQTLSIKVMKVVDILPYIIASVVTLAALALLVYWGVKKLLKRKKQ